MDLMTRRRALMAKIIALVKMVVTSATGLVSFVTDIVRPVKVTCEFSPVQEGTGNPSPDNVRPISGWTGCEITQTGYNILNLAVDVAVAGAYVDGKRILQPYKYYLGIHATNIAYYNPNQISDFAVSGQGFSFVTISYPVGITFRIKGGTKIKQKLTGENISIGYITFFDKDWNVISGAWNNNNGISVPTNAVYAMARVGAATAGQQTTVTNFTIAYEDGTIESQLFAGATLPINWQTEAGTVYGGTVTLNEDGSADLVVTQAKWVEDGHREPDIAVWTRGSDSQDYNRTLFGRLPSGMEQETKNGAAFDLFICNNRRMAGVEANLNYPSFGAYTVPGYSFSYTIPKGIETKAEIAAYFADNPSEICYNLLTPKTYHFTSIAKLNASLGENNIWHNMNGSITAEYYKKQ